jgi:AAA domain
VWDPVAGPPPVWDGTWETCIVFVRDYQTVQLAYQWLNVSPHPFRSVTIDSISEVQQRCVDALVGTNQMQQQEWGELLRSVSTLVRNFRDLTTHPTLPLEVVTMIAMTREQSGKWKPYMQGQIAVTLPYYIDVIGYYYSQPLETGFSLRRLLVSPQSTFEAGDRTGRLGQVIDEPTIPHMLEMIYGTIAT